MTTLQLSVFLENKTGRLNDVAKVLAEAGINMTAFSVADNSDFGILRVLVSDPEKAKEVLKEKGFAVKLTNVLALRIGNSAGTLYGILDKLAESKVYIEYMYAFSEGEQASVVIRPNDIDQAIEILKANKIEFVG
ncbi:MAG: ACT domain-containing protein [Paludibacteraceae bacterium]|nr:ACT domain-containing protein [Paludibacteraceae bacterium]MBR2493597.1 ACT domain-containing protein [Paludibacteraceae bacterium]MBR6686855.1 ACT domain-containing protein [Paludibacteraceae bacterium]